jgi:hypothetical protein
MIYQLVMVQVLSRNGNGIMAMAIRGTYNAAPFTHQYTSNGTFNISLKVTDANGCSDTISIANAVNVIQKPVASLVIIDTLNCFSSPVSFFDRSTGQQLGRHWFLGDGRYIYSKLFSAHLRAAGYLQYRNDYWNAPRLFRYSESNCKSYAITKYRRWQRHGFVRGAISKYEGNRRKDLCMASQPFVKLLQLCIPIGKAC